MPQQLEHIDAIARHKRRDVLYLDFHAAKDRLLDYEVLPVRRQIIEWLDRQGIGWQPCGAIASENSLQSYRGQIYIDVPFIPADPVYQKLQAYLEHPDGRIRFAEVSFYVLPLDIAMRNAHHDEPGFWEGWADRF